MPSGPRGRYLYLSATILILDQLTKFWIDRHQEFGYQPLVFVNGFAELVSWRNPGALFSLMTDAPDPWRKIVLTVLPLGAICAIAYLMKQARSTDRMMLTGYALVLGGALGNLFDRVVRGSVVDFLHFGIGAEPVRSWLVGYFGTHWWPAFNVADSAICVGATAIALQMFRFDAARSPEHGPSPEHDPSPEQDRPPENEMTR